VQGIDIDTQKARASYASLTGRSPTGYYPTFVPGAETASRQTPAWLSTTLALAVVGFGGLVLLKYAPGARSDASKPEAPKPEASKPLPSPSK
jgi:hypothetical protein